MLSGRLAKAERGELAIPLPIGYVRRPSGEAVFDPDEQAQHVVRLVFSAFSRLGTINGVLRYLVGQEVQLPVRVHAGPAKGELEWRRPTRETLQNMLHNPVYAGYFAWGRRQVDQRRKAPGRPGTGRVVKDSTEWLVLLPGRLHAYITEEEYEANAARMAANQQTAAAPGAPRDGAALLSGLKPGDALPPRAVTLLTEVAAVAPDAPAVLWYLGVAAARDGRPGDAREKWTKLLTALPTDGEDSKMVRAALKEIEGQ